MRYLLVLAVGLLGGWFGHALIVTPPTPRADAARPVVEAPPAPAPETVPLPPAPTLPKEEAVKPAEKGENVPEAADPEMEAFAEMLRSQSKLWKGMTGYQAKQRAEAFLARLPFDAEREKKIQELFQKEAELQAELAIEMLLGKAEMDPNAFSWFMGMPSELSPRLEGDLATFMNDGEIQVVRAEVKRTYDQQVSDLADMQIGMMAIHDLSDDQRTRMREVYRGKDMMTEQFTRFADITRDREKFRRLLRGEGLREEMDRGFAPMRQRMRDILNNEQYGKYEAFEKQLVQMAENNIRMMGSLLGRPREGTQAPVSK